MILLVGCDTNSLRKEDFHGLSERSLPAQSIADANRRNHIGHEIRPSPLPPVRYVSSMTLASRCQS